MKKVLTAVAMACVAVASLAAAMPRSAWQAKIGESAQNPTVLKEIIGQLSSADQVVFLAEVNEAISKMPGSDEQKAAMFLDANRAAVAGATADNRAAVLAEVFATVPPEYLTVVNESFASDLFNRNANPSKPMSDADFKALATATMAKIVARCASAENSAVRDTFAALMFERASGGSPADLRDALVSTLPAGAQESASTESIPSAMGEGREKSYDAMLGASGAGDEPDHAAALALVSGQLGQAVFVDMQSGAVASSSGLSGAAFSAPGIVGTSTVLDQPGTGLDRVPRAHVFSKTAVGRDADGNKLSDSQENPYYTGKHRGDKKPGEFEPNKYPGQY